MTENGHVHPVAPSSPFQNRRLTLEERAKLGALLNEVRARLNDIAGSDTELRFALNRRLVARLSYDERGTPALRTKLKIEKWKEQEGLCAICKKPIEQKGSELDRTKASLGYTLENTRLVHHQCHVDDQRRKGFSDARPPASNDEAAIPDTPKDAPYDGSPM